MAIESESQLLAEAREVTRRDGLVAARELLEQRFEAMDESEGELQRRVLETTRDPQRVLPDSLAALPPAERARVAIVIVPGTKLGFGPPSTTRLALGEAAKEAEAMGFASHFIDTPPRGGVVENAEEVAVAVRPIYGQVDHVLFVNLSKGAHDLIQYLQAHALDLPAGDREKIRSVFSLVGTVQGSVVADYFGNAPRVVPALARATLQLNGRASQVAMLRTVAATPWHPEAASRMSEGFPNLTWVSIVSLPDGDDGRISARLWSPFIRGLIRTQSPYYSPADGLVESAGAVLPDEVELHEWVVYAYGSHSLPNGRYRDGTPVAPRTADPAGEKLNPEGGAEVISAYLRALPVTLLNGAGRS